MLENCDIYVTLEPCIMCASAIQQARIKNVYYGTKDIRMGGYGSKIDVSAIQGLNHYPIIHQIKNQDECGQILKDFLDYAKGTEIEFITLDKLINMI